MKKILSVIICIALVFSLTATVASADSVTAPSDGSFTKIDVSLNPVIYHTPDAAAGNYGFDWYDDSEGEQKLVDGVIPTEADLNQAKEEMEDEDHKEYYAWHGWIGIARTVDHENIIELNKTVFIDFEFEFEFPLAEIAVYACAMTAGSVGVPDGYYVYVSEDGENWTEDYVASNSASGVAYEYVQETTLITLDTPVNCRYVRLVIDASDGAAWTFLSEVEFYQDLLADDTINVGDLFTETDTGDESSEDDSSEGDDVSEDDTASESEESSDDSTESEDKNDTPAASEEDEGDSDTSKGGFTPNTGVSDDVKSDGGSLLWLWIVIAVVVVAAVVVVIVVKKKK